MREHVHAHAATNAHIEIFDQSVGAHLMLGCISIRRYCLVRDNFLIGGSHQICSNYR